MVRELSAPPLTTKWPSVLGIKLKCSVNDKQLNHCSRRAGFYSRRVF